jgi:hypothetical protein
MTESSPRRWAWSAAIAALTVAALLLGHEAVVSPLRPPIVTLFIAVCPGLALVRLLRLRRPAIEALLAVALSLVLAVSIALALLSQGARVGANVVTILAAICLLGVVAEAALGGARAAAPTAREEAADVR